MNDRLSSSTEKLLSMQMNKKIAYAMNFEVRYDSELF